MNIDYIIDDRFDYIKHGDEINNMTDEEFEKYTKDLKKQESVDKEE